MAKTSFSEKGSTIGLCPKQTRWEYFVGDMITVAVPLTIVTVFFAIIFVVIRSVI